MLKYWPSGEKPREKLLARGPQALSDAELLAIFMRTGVQGVNVVELSRKLLGTFGSLSAVFQASRQDFCQIHGLGVAKYVQLQACLELVKRCLSEELVKGDLLVSSHASKAFLISQLRHEHREIFAVLLLDSQHQVISFEKLFFGTLNAAAVYPRVVVETAIRQHAHAVILAHNHPSGVAESSCADRQITQTLVKALKLVDINVLDHMIVAGNQCYSFAEHGEL